MFRSRVYYFRHYDEVGLWSPILDNLIVASKGSWPPLWVGHENISTNRTVQEHVVPAVLCLSMLAPLLVSILIFWTRIMDFISNEKRGDNKLQEQQIIHLLELVINHNHSAMNTIWYHTSIDETYAIFSLGMSEWCWVPIWVTFILANIFSRESCTH
jgi:hypothetical protein